MKQYSSREAAKKLGISFTSLNRYIAQKKIPVPAVQQLGGGQFRIWMDEDIERVRALLPKIANGRKTRYQKQGRKQTKRKPKP
ncbi:MAG: hypothetical protein LAP21_21550 [Acidobacteriia bacterium]|nr:hypothetical protein [Terriglobia bacterium]